MLVCSLSQSDGWGKGRGSGRGSGGALHRLRPSDGVVAGQPPQGEEPGHVLGGVAVGMGVACELGEEGVHVSWSERASPLPCWLPVVVQRDELGEGISSVGLWWGRERGEIRDFSGGGGRGGGSEISVWAWGGGRSEASGPLRECGA